MITFRIHFTLRTEPNTFDIESKSSDRARREFLGRFDKDVPQPIIKKIKVVK